MAAGDVESDVDVDEADEEDEDEEVSVDEVEFVDVFTTVDEFMSD